MIRSAAVVHESGDGLDPERAHPRQALVRKRPVILLRRSGGGPLPEQRISQRSNSERSNPFEIVATRVVTVQRKLIEACATHAIQ
jgi:hypothetical protein